MTKQEVLERAMAVLGESDGDITGICLACGAEAYGVEPDARAYECEECGARKVYGAEEIIVCLGV